MKNILIFGAGRSSWFTIDYLFKHKQEFGWNITVADAAEAGLEACKADFPEADTRIADVLDDNERMQLILGKDIVISLLPAQYHILVAKDCLKLGIHLITPSYLTPEIMALRDDIKKAGLIFLNELGLDPGIDHMSAMQIIDRLRTEAEISSFRSYCGGLIAKEFDDNPWHYKFTWNPYSIVTAAHDGGLALSNDQYKYLPHNRLFAEASTLTSPEGEVFDAIMNRNSIPYIDYYGLQGVKTFERGTLRYAGFCRKWQYVANSGLTTEKVVINNNEVKTWQNYLNIFLPDEEEGFERFAKFQPHELFEEDRNALEWLFTGAGLLPGHATPAQSLHHLLLGKWTMKPGETDRIVMQHEIEYTKNGKNYLHRSFLDLTGQDEKRTAMAKTVGLPLGIAAQLITQDKISARGLVLPTEPELYEPQLQVLEKHGIRFIEDIEEL